MKRFFDNTLFTLIDYLLLVALNLLATPILIRNFGVEGYGAFIFLSIFSIYGAFSFFDLGMEGSLMNFVARFEATGDRKKLHNTLSISILYYALIGIILGILLYFTSGFIASRLLDDGSKLSLTTVLTSIDYIALNIFLQFLTIPFTAILQGLRRFVITKGVNSVMNILRYALVIIAAVYYGRIDYAFLIILGLTLIRLILLSFITAFKTDYFRGMKIQFDLSLLRTLISYSSLLFINRLVGLVWNQIDKVLIWLYLAVTSMTIYDVIARPASLLRLVMSVLNSAVIPEVARLHETGDIPAISALYIRLIRFAYMIVLPALAVFFIYIDVLLELWVGQMFVPHAYLAMILLSVYLVLPIPSVASTMVIGLEQVRQTIWIPITAAIINIVLSLVLLQFWGLAGLLVATLAAEIFATVPYFTFMKRQLAFSFWPIAKSVVKILFIAAVAGLGYFLIRRIMPGQYLIAGTLCAIVFCLNLWANYMFLLNRNEKQFLSARWKSIRNRLTVSAISS